MRKRVVAVIRLLGLLAGILVVMCLGALCVVIFYPERNEDNYAIRLIIENNTNHQIFAVMFPVVTWEGTVVDKFSTSDDWRVLSQALSPEPRERTTVSVMKPRTKILGRINTEQIRLEPHLAYDIDYYLGKNVRFEDLRIIVVTWFADAGWDSDLLQTPPHKVYTLYNPKYATGPDTYDSFGSLVIE